MRRPRPTIASASALFKSIRAQSYDVSRGLGCSRYTAALYNTPCYYLLYYVTARVVSPVINFRTGELTRRYISSEERGERQGRMWVENRRTDTHWYARENLRVTISAGQKESAARETLRSRKADVV